MLTMERKSTDGDWELGQTLTCFGPETAIVVTKGSGGLHGGGGRGLETAVVAVGQQQRRRAGERERQRADGGSDHLGRFVELVFAMC